MTAIATKQGQERSQLIDDWDRAHSWHPLTQMKEYCSIPSLHIEPGEGCCLWDTEGNRYLDGNASIWTNALGHNDPDINRVLVDQVGKVSHTTYLGLSHPAGAELGHCLVELSPGNLTRALFSDNGSNAIEIALKLSFQYWQLVEKPEKRLVVGMEGGYHVDTFGAMSAANSESFHGRFRAWQFDSRAFPRTNCAEINGRIVAQEMDRRGLFEPLSFGVRSRYGSFYSASCLEGVQKFSGYGCFGIHDSGGRIAASES